MRPLFIIPALIVCFIIGAVIRTIQNKQAISFRIRSSYGDKDRVKADVRDRMDSIALLYEREKKELRNDEIVDDITWNDLEMDNIFFRADHTDCFAGEQYLYSTLHILGSREREPRLSSEVISFFDENEEKRNEVRKYLYSVGKPISAYYAVGLAEEADKRYLPFRYIYPVMLGTLLIFGIPAVVLMSPVFTMLFIFNYLVNFVAYIFLRGTYENRLESLFSAGMTINAASKVSGMVPQFSKSVEAPLKKLKKTAKILSLLNMKRSMMMSDDILSQLSSYITGPLMISFILYNRGASELADKKEEYMQVYRYLGSIDCSIAVGSFRKSLPHCCVPELSEEKRFEFKQVFHPMLDDPVANDFRSERHAIITGSNASGKSTFIKAAAINLILGQSILTCTAEHATVPYCGVITSMAVRDDLLTGESYYIREIKYLKRMVELADSGRLIFLAIDEILKGTNTVERIAASKAVLRYFDSRNCLLMVATHDIELAQSFDGVYSNYHFCESLEDGDVVFDYTIHDGISRSSNAIRLLSVIGFPDEIIDDAMSEIK